MTPDRRPLVLHVIHHLFIGGMENGLVNLVNRMPASKYRHAIACVEDYSDFRNRIERDDVEVFALHRGTIGVWRLRHRLYRLCKNLAPAIVHSRNLSGLDALAPARLAGVRHCVHGEHGWEVTDLDGSAMKPALLRRLHRPLVSRYITVSKHLASYLTERVGVPSQRITQIYNGVDTGRFAPAPRSAAHLPPGFVPDDGVLIGTVGRIQPVKDQATLLQAFAGLVQHQPALRATLRLAVIGDGPLLDDLKALAHTLGIAQHAWFPGAADNVPGLLAAMDVFVLPSLNEGISNTILEAMASGLPVIASDRGGNPELVADGCGALFEPGDVETLAMLLGDYAASPSLRRRHGAAARRLACERFGLDIMVQRYCEVYDSLCSAAAKAQP